MPQFFSVGQTISSHLSGVCLVSLNILQRIISKVPDQRRVDRADVQSLVMKDMSHRLIVVPGMLHVGDMNALDDSSHTNRTAMVWESGWLSKFWTLRSLEVSARPIPIPFYMALATR